MLDGDEKERLMMMRYVMDGISRNKIVNFWVFVGCVLSNQIEWSGLTLDN